MKLPLQEFEQHIDETILKRGFQYYKRGLVNEPEEISPGDYEAIVEGTEPYTVQLTIKNEVVTEYVCSCPYDMGPVCKHVVAVIFHLKQIEFEPGPKTIIKKGKEKLIRKKKTVAEQVDEVLEKISYDNLKDYIRERCLKDSSFRQLFLAHNAYLVNPESQALYAKQIRAILKSATERGGYIGYSGARYTGMAVYELLQVAEKRLESSDYQSALYIACAVLEEMTKALQYADDSNGDFGGCIDTAISVFYTLAHQTISDDLRKAFFNYCINAYKKEIFKGWDWHLSMLDLAGLLSSNSGEAEQILSLLNLIKPSDSEWMYEETQGIRLKLIRKTEGDEKATQFLEQNLSIPDFRKKAIETALSDKDYAKAIILAEEGIKQDDKASPGLADDWRDYLLKIYTNQNDTEKILKYGRHLFIHGNRTKDSYFDLLKKHVPSADWESYLKLILQDIVKKNHWADYSLIAQIYIWEKSWDNLFDLVRQNVSLPNLDAYAEYLMKDYADEITGFYQTAILKYMEYNVSRGHYQVVCRYLRKLIKMGAREKADFTRQQLKTFYPKRKALMEELEKV